MIPVPRRAGLLAGAFVSLLALASAGGEVGAVVATSPARQVPGATVEWEAPSLYIEGEAFPLQVTIAAQGDQGYSIPTWYLTSSLFEIGASPLGPRGVKDSLTLEPGTKLSIELELGPRLKEAQSFGQALELRAATDAEGQTREVVVLRRAERGIDFMTLPVEQLGDYQVVFRTSRGTMRAELWPQVAPNHVRNFLDLADTGFYDGTNFHRVIPGFMIQGGRARKGLTAPRKVEAEFSDKRHVPGVLSMARLGSDIHSADSEFFIVHAEYPSLDGQYSAFGQLVSGLDVVDKIVHSGDSRFRANDPRGHTPKVEQVIEKVIVVKAPRGR